MNTKTTFAIIAVMAVLAAVIAPWFIYLTSAKISEVIIKQRCQNPAEKEPGGQQAVCKGEGQQQMTVAENQIPAWQARPGQNK